MRLTKRELLIGSIEQQPADNKEQGVYFSHAHDGALG